MNKPTRAPTKKSCAVPSPKSRAENAPTHPGIAHVLNWFTLRGLNHSPFQRQAWNAYLAGKSGLIQAPTGAGKTLAAAMGPMIEYLDEDNSRNSTSLGTIPGLVESRLSQKKRRDKTQALTIVWITPLRALAADTVQSLNTAITDLGLNWSVELRTSDTSASLRKKQKDRLPTVLVTTPESLSLLLSYPDPQNRFASLQAVIVDEWHELMGSKRGVQTELGFRRICDPFAPICACGA